MQHVKLCINYIISLSLVHAKLGQYCDYTDNPARQCYIKEVLATVTHSPNQLAVDKTTNSLYFSFDYGQGDYIPARLDLETKKIKVLKGIKDAFALAYDDIKNEMYFGGSYGIYKYNITSKTLKHLNISNLDIWWLYAKNSIYFIKFPSLNAYYYEKRTIKSMNGLIDASVHQFVFDKDENVFFINSTGLYGIGKDKNAAAIVDETSKFIGMASDNDGYVYVCSDDGIYIVRKIMRKVSKVVHIQGVLAMAFDKANHLIYSDSHELVRLLPMHDFQNRID